MENSTPFGSGAVRSLTDYRQINLEHIAGVAPEPTVTKVMLDYSNVPDFFQRMIGACTTHAFAEIYTHRMQRLTPGNAFVASPRFLYTMSRMDDGLPAGDNGTYCNQPFKEAVKWGVASEAIVPNDTSLTYDAYVYSVTAANVPQAAFTEADQYRIPGYVQVGQFDSVTPANIIQALQTPDGQDGITIALPVGTEWYTAPSGAVSWAKADLIPIRHVITRLSGHQVTCIGIELEDGTNRWKVYFRNHWSLNWASTSGIEGGTQPQDIDGDTGWFYLDQHIISESWMVCEIPNALLQLVRGLPNQKDFSHQWDADLGLGSRGPEVQALQIALKIVGTFPFLQNVTEYYGPITAHAVMDFQRKYKIADEATIVAAAGHFGPLTRIAINKMFSHN